MTALSVTSACATPLGKASTASAAKSFDVLSIMDSPNCCPAECYRAARGSPSRFGRRECAANGATGAKWRGAKWRLVRQPSPACDIGSNGERSHCRRAWTGYRHLGDAFPEWNRSVRQRPVTFVLAMLAAALLSGRDALAEGETIDQALCRMIEGAAATHRLPVDFFTRLIWQESSFRPGVSSPAGAQGVAQFMPGTARDRGLTDPFDPEQAIPKSAELLSELRARFGNLGL